MESILWAMNNSNFSANRDREVPSEKKKAINEAKTGSILKMDRLSSDSDSSSLNVKFQGDAEVPSTPPPQEGLSEKIKSLTHSLQDVNMVPTMSHKEVDEMLQKREDELRTEFNQQLDKEIEELKIKFDDILQSEQLRTAYMLSGAHRERKEKIKALKTQLECKNLAGLMYVMCTERKKCKMEKLKIEEEYTKYIKELQLILKDSQEVILNLSRGYKTAARVDREWRDKMMAVLNEFRAFVYNFAGGCVETNQYFFDIPKLMKLKASTKDNPKEDPCECDCEPEQQDSGLQRKDWWDRFNDETQPFVIFGDMEPLTQPQKIIVHKATKAAKPLKTAPSRWKEYVFNQIPFLDDCSNLNDIKDQYLDRIPLDKWECHVHSDTNVSVPSIIQSAYQSRRVTAASIDYRNMGSILKIITASTQQTFNKTMLLGAKDSMEIASTTKLKRKSAVDSNEQLLAQRDDQRQTEEKGSPCICVSQSVKTSPPKEVQYKSPRSSDLNAKDVEPSLSLSKLGSTHNDSLEHIPAPSKVKDRLINLEKECPMPECQAQVDAFTRSLPEYMKASPFMHFEVSFDSYETCSPEQLQILRERIENRKRDRESAFTAEEPLAEWPAPVGGVHVQTSEVDVRDPPCTCREPRVEEVPSLCKMYNVENLLPLKKALDEIKKTAFYDPTIQFNRFEVVGEPSDISLDRPKRDFKTERVDEILRILRKHPSLGDLFQANHRC